MAQTEVEVKQWAVYKCPECSLGNLARAEDDQRETCGRCGASLQNVDASSPITILDPRTQALGFSPSYAGLGQRFGARFFDSLIFGTISFILVSIATSTAGFGLFAMVLLGVFILGLFNELVLVVLRGQSVGKMIMSIRIADEKTGENPSWGAAFIRLVVQSIPIVSFIDPLWAIWDPKRQALHDKAARTLVIDNV